MTDGLIQSPFLFHSVFLYIFQRFERNSKRSENESLFEDDRFQRTRERIRFDFVRVHAFRNAPNSSRFVSHSLLGTSFAVPFHPRIRRRIRDAISISIVPLLRNEKKKTVHEEREGERRVQRDEHNLGWAAVVTMIFPVYFNRVIHFSRGFEREKNISVSLSIHLALFQERERKIHAVCFDSRRSVMRISKRNYHSFKEKFKGRDIG